MWSNALQSESTAQAIRGEVMESRHRQRSEPRLNGVARTTRSLALGLTSPVLRGRETGPPSASRALLGADRDQDHREGPDETPQEQANEDASEEVVAHDVVTMA